MYAHRAPQTRYTLRRVLSPALRAMLRRTGRWEDLWQEVALCQWEQHGNGDYVYGRALQRAVYHWLRAEGFRRERDRYERPVKTLAETIVPADGEESES